jgi:hypothetical protein
MTTQENHGPIHALLQRIPAFIGLALAFLTGGEQVFPLSIIIIVVSLYYLVSGLVRKDLPTPKALATHVAIAAGFILLSIVTLILSGPSSYYILAGTWLLHATWDSYLYRKNAAVPRWLTQFCIVYDVIVAILLVVTATNLV